MNALGYSLAGKQFRSNFIKEEEKMKLKRIISAAGVTALTAVLLAGNAAFSGLASTETPTAPVIDGVKDE